MKRKRKIWTGIILIIAIITGVYLYSRFDPSNYAFFPKCPVYTLTGYKCPGCGAQRAFYNLFQGNFLTAFRYNPLMFVLVPYVLAGIYMEYIANLPDDKRYRMRNIFYGKWAALILFSVITVYTVLRNTC
ncbi:MAG: DUF2752 domain-containing protein [Tannerella sp.]|jgi:hypothetical protein|nr:DUF2752 domain-containing protein [Tannerella sp.]